MTHAFAKKVRQTLRGQLGPDAANRIARLSPTSEEELHRMSKELELILMPKISKDRGVEICFSPARLADAIDKHQPTDQVRNVLDLFLVSVLFRRRDELFNPQKAVKISNSPAMQYLIGSTPFISSFLLAALSYSRNQPEAWDLYRKAALESEKAQIPNLHHFGGLKFARSSEELWAIVNDHSEKLHEPEKIKFLKNTFVDNLPICLVGLDAKYFEIYAPQLIKSARGIANIHFHISNPEGVELLTADGVNYSTEYKPDATPSYFASMRFLRLPEFLEHYRRPITVMDADSVFTRPLDKFISRAGNSDISVNINQRSPRQYFWRHLNAQIFYAKPNDAALTVLTYFAQLFNHLYDSTSPSWWIDQAVLSQAISLAAENDQSLKVENAGFKRYSGITQKKMPFATPRS